MLASFDPLMKIFTVVTLTPKNHRMANCLHLQRLRRKSSWQNTCACSVSH